MNGRSAEFDRRVHRGMRDAAVSQIRGDDIAGNGPRTHNRWRGGAIARHINEDDYHEKACARTGSGLCCGVYSRVRVGVPRQQRIGRCSRNSEHGAGRSVLPPRRLLVPRPHQRLLPGRLGLRLDQLLSFGESQQSCVAQQQDSRPLVSRIGSSHTRAARAHANVGTTTLVATDVGPRHRAQT